MASTITNMQQLLQNLTNDLCKNFEEMHHQLANLDTRLHTIEQACIHGDTAIFDIHARLDREATIDNLEAKTNRVMIATGKFYLKNNMEEPYPSNTLYIIMEGRTTYSWHHQHHSHHCCHASLRLADHPPTTWLCSQP
jgi:hypothetical protein